MRTSFGVLGVTDQSRDVLARLALPGTAELLVADGANVVHAIADLRTAEAKATAADPIAS